MKFADVCALMPEGVYWGDGLTPEIARRLVEAGHAYAAAVSAAENARLREALQAVQTAMHKAWAEGRLTSPPWTPELAAQVNEALKGQP
jgi:hypothetical protein